MPVQPGLEALVPLGTSVSTRSLLNDSTSVLQGPHVVCREPKRGQSHVDDLDTLFAELKRGSKEGQFLTQGGKLCTLQVRG